MKRFAQLLSQFEVVVVAALQLFLVVATTLAIFSLWRILWVHFDELLNLNFLPDLQLALQRAFSGVLLALLGLELLETLHAFTETHQIRLQVILAVALIAVGRHIMVLDFEHVSGVQTLGVAALVLALVGGYYVLGLKQPGASGAGTEHGSAA